jgi:hypothetical protein
MARRPEPTSIFHITHVDNLASIIGDGGLLSDVEMEARGAPHRAVGMSSIKQRRMRLPVKCHPGDVVGEYVPFYFCPRSIMLYLLHMANHPELTYRGGQGPIVHLQLDLHRAVGWAQEARVRWAFTLANAGAAYAPFRGSLDQLDDVDWESVAADDFRDARVKEGKQAEFLIQRCVPWELVERIGVRSERAQERAQAAVAGAAHRPPVDILPRWYF